jgi:hypothetical protein
MACASCRVHRVHVYHSNRGLLVSPSEGGLDVSVPRELLLDGDPQASLGGLGGLGLGSGAVHVSRCESLCID